MKTLILLFVTLFLEYNGFAQDWVYIGSDNDENKYYVKSTYVTKDVYEGSIKLWIKKEMKKVTIKKNGKPINYLNAKELQLFEIDCNEKKIKIVSSIVYNSQGKVVDSWTLRDYEQEWNDIVPDSIGEAISDKTCELFN